MRFRALIVVMSLGFPGTLRAQTSADAPCTEDPETCGRRAFDAGVEAYQRSAWKEALAHFRTAYAIRHYPIVIYNLALTEEKLALYVEALEHAKELGVAPDRTPDLARKGKDLETRLARKIATLTVDLPNARDVKLFVDEKPMRDFEDVQINPGKHAVRVIADGSERIRRDIQANPGERVVLTLDAKNQTIAADKPGADAKTAPDRSSNGLSPAWFYASASATILVGGIAVWSGIDTLNKKKDYDDRKSTLTAAEENELLDDGHARERRTNILLAATGVLTVGTLALGAFAVDWDEGDKRVSLVPTLGGAMLVGRY